MSCNGCVSYKGKGCAHPMSSLGFDEEPRRCDLFYPLAAPKDNPGRLPVQRPALSARDEAERRAVHADLHRLQNEHARHNWSTRLDRSQGANR